VILLDPVVEVLAPADAIGFKERRERSRSRLSPSQAMIASRLVWLPSMTMRGAGKRWGVKPQGRIWRA